MTNENNSEYFDLVTTGIGYLNRSRTVNPIQGDKYESVSISALRGKSNDVNYTYYDTNVVGSDAIEFIKKYKDDINNKDSKFLVRFNVGDSMPSSFTLSNGENKGKVCHNIKARLLKITYASINGNVIYSEKSDTDNQAPDEAQNESTDTSQTTDFHTWMSELDDVVKLGRGEPDFRNKLQFLSDNGYEFDHQKDHWNLNVA